MAVLGRLGRSWGGLGAVLAGLGRFRGGLGAVLGSFWEASEAQKH